MKKRIKELKKLLGDGYLFCRLKTDKEIRQLQKKEPSEFETEPVAVLIAGCVKIECCLYRTGGGLQLGYDIYVKDSPETKEWIFYDSPPDEAVPKETKMLAALDRTVTQNHLSYTDCCFERLKGKTVRQDSKAKKDRP